MEQTDGVVSVGVGMKAPAVIPPIHVAQCRYFFRAADYAGRARYFDSTGRMNSDAREEYREDDPKQELLNNFRLYGRQLQLRQLANLSKGPNDILHEAIEVRQLVRALHVYQSETQGMYLARNTMESAIQDAVDAVLKGSKPSLVPSSTSGATHLNPTPGAAKRKNIEGYFRQPDPKRATRPFSKINFV